MDGWILRARLLIRIGTARVRWFHGGWLFLLFFFKLKMLCMSERAVIPSTGRYAGRINAGGRRAP